MKSRFCNRNSRDMKKKKNITQETGNKEILGYLYGNGVIDKDGNIK